MSYLHPGHAASTSLYARLLRTRKEGQALLQQTVLDVNMI
jgi:hypothetical protein